MIRVAIFADIHGKFLLPFKLVEHYQFETGKPIDWIIQCGDMGAFPDKKKLDKATLRHAQKDRDELGFLDDFCDVDASIESYLNKLDIPMLCVRGNHEDHEFLDACENQSDTSSPYYPIDCYQKVYVMKTGHAVCLTPRHNAGDEQLSMVGVGRIGDRKGRQHSPFIQAYEEQRLKTYARQCGGECDVLITHDKEVDSQRGYGTQQIADLLDAVAFRYHFHGHTGEPFHVREAENGITKIVKIKELEFNYNGTLEEGCMMILEKDNDTLTMEAVPLSDIIHFTRGTWKYM